MSENPVAPNQPAAAPTSAAGGVRAEPLIDRMGRTYAELVAAGKKILPKLHPVTKLFMPKGGRKPGSKSKPKMETPATSSAVSSTAENSVAGSTPPAADAPPSPPPSFADVDRAAASAPKDETPGARAEALTEEIAAVNDNTTADTIIGIIQTGLILIGEEEGVLSPLEVTSVRRPLVRVLSKYNVGENAMPAEIDLGLAVLGLVVARLSKPKTATKWLRFKAWCVNQWFAFNGKKLAAQVEEKTAPNP